MQQSDFSYQNIKPGPDPLRIPDTAHTPDFSEVREPAYAAEPAQPASAVSATERAHAENSRAAVPVQAAKAVSATEKAHTENSPAAVPVQAASPVSTMEKAPAENSRTSILTQTAQTRALPDISPATDLAQTGSAQVPDTALPAALEHPQRIHASNASDQIFAAMKRLYEKAPRIHCLTNAVTMNDVANVLLAIGGSAIMAQDRAEAAQITALCAATLLNTGTPSDEKFAACLLAGEAANGLGHPVVLDPVGAGASTYRKENIGNLLQKIHPDLIRCNLEEALVLLALVENAAAREDGCDLEPIEPSCAYTPKAEQILLREIPRGGVESAMDAAAETCATVAAQLATACRTTVLISGGTDAVSDGTRTALITGGDIRITRITGSGCMLSAICAALLAAEETAYDAALNASIFWKQAAEYAGQKTDSASAGMGSFHMHLFDAATNLGCIRI